MKKIVENERLIYKCCKLYYEENMTQQRISEKLGISRVSVSKMLQQGKELGIVKVHVISPDRLAYNHLAPEIETVFALKEVVVVENDPLATNFEDQNAISLATISLLENYLHDHDVVGVSMGRTLHNVCLGRRESEDSVDCTFVPVVGGLQSGRGSNMSIHANKIAADFAGLFGAKYVDFFAPAIFTDKSVKEAFKNEAPVREIERYYSRLSMVIMGIGIPRRFTSTIVKAGFLEADEINSMVERGAVGDLSLQFFDREGKTDSFHDFNSRVSGLPLELMRRVEHKLCIASGKVKAEAVYGAINGGLINMLVMDQNCANALLELKKGESKE